MKIVKKARKRKNAGQKSGHEKGNRTRHFEGTQIIFLGKRVKVENKQGSVKYKNMS